MSGYGSSDSSWSDTNSRKKSNGVKHQKFKRMGTNVHSSIGGGISVHNALMTLEPPPPDAKPGSKDAPWLRLTDWEMMMLRKRMKKNAKWRPSESMVHLELINFGRGPHNYWEAKKKAESEGAVFLDIDNIATANPDKPRAWGEVSLTAPSSSEDIPRNKGMALNEAKKRKRDEFLASSSRRDSKNNSDTELQPEEGVSRRPKRKTVTRDFLSQYSRSSESHSSTDSPSSDGFRAGDEVDSDNTEASRGTGSEESSLGPIAQPKMNDSLQSVIGASTSSHTPGGEMHRIMSPTWKSQTYGQATCEPTVEDQQQTATTNAQDRTIAPRSFSTKPTLEAKGPSLSNTKLSSQILKPSGSQHLNTQSTSSTSAKPRMLYDTTLLSTSNTVASGGPGPSTRRSEPHLPRHTHSDLAAALGMAHTGASPQTSTTSPAMPLQHPSYSPSSTATSHNPPFASPQQPNIATSKASSYANTFASLKPAATLPGTSLPLQSHSSTSIDRSQQPVSAIRIAQMPKPKALFDHRESLSKIVGRKPPLMKSAHRLSDTPTTIQAPPTFQPSSMRKNSSMVKPSSVITLKMKPSLATKALSATKPTIAIKLPTKPKVDSAGDGPPLKKRKYIPGGPGGGGRYVDI